MASPLGDGELDPLEVMQANMAFYHQQSGEILATIMEMPFTGEAGDRLQALLRFADMARMRSAAQECARDLAKYRYHPMGAKPYEEPPPDPNADRGESPKVIDQNPELEDVVKRFAAARSVAPAATANGHAISRGGRG